MKEKPVHSGEKNAMQALLDTMCDMVITCPLTVLNRIKIESMITVHVHQFDVYEL